MMEGQLRPIAHRWLKIAALPTAVLVSATACGRPGVDGDASPAAATSIDSAAATRVLASAAGALETSADRSGYASVGELDMYYEIHGEVHAEERTPLVLLHGGGSTIRTTFGRVLPALSATRQVIAVETQGHGHTADIDRPLTFEQDADDVAALVRQLGFDRADIFGFSNGGNVALQIGIRHPGLARRLVVASAFIGNDGLDPAVRASFSTASVDNMPGVLRTAYLDAAPEPAKLPVLVDKLMRRLIEFRDLSPDAIRAIQAPTLIILGDADVISPEHGVRMATLLPNAQLAIVPNSDHGAYLGEVTAMRRCDYCPEAVVSMVERFLDRPDAHTGGS